VKSLSCGVNLDVVKILNSHVYVWRSLLYVYVLKMKGLINLWRRISGTRLQELSMGEILSMYFVTPSMFITLWFGFDYGTNPPLGMLII
jgi:hypothetical protein